MRCPLPRARTFTALSSGSAHLDHPNSAGHAPRLPGRHPAVRAARAMGRLDRTGGYRPHRGIQRRYMCDAPDIGEQEGAQEADRGERGHERPKLLRELEPATLDGRPASESRQPAAYER